MDLNSYMKPSLKKHHRWHILYIIKIIWLKTAEAKATADGQNSGETHEKGTEGEKQTLLKLSGKRTEDETDFTGLCGLFFTGGFT
jgi:hypothetical protein